MMGSESDAFGDADTVFSDVVFNIFAIFLIFLLVIPVAFSVSEADAPTRNREEHAFLTQRDCHVEVMRPPSQFVLYGRDRMMMVDYDAIALKLARRGGDNIVTPDGVARVSMDVDGADANVFSMTFTPFPRPFEPEGKPSKRRLKADRVFLQAEVYGKGAVPYFEVPMQNLPDFSALFQHLVKTGERFRWRLLSGESMARFRSEGAFQSADFCR